MTDVKNSKPLSREEIRHKVIVEALANPAFKARLIKEPHVVLKEHGLDVPTSVKINVVSETPTERYLVLPSSAPQASGGSFNPDAGGVQGYLQEY